MTVQRFEKKDGAVNVAGTLSWVMPNAWTPDEFLNRIFAPKTRETFLYCMRAELREMAVGASIVLVVPGDAAHSSSRAAVIELTRTAVNENPSILVNCVSPDFEQTSIEAAEEQVIRDKRQAQSNEVADAIAFLLSDAASSVTGAIYDVESGQVC